MRFYGYPPFSYEKFILINTKAELDIQSSYIPCFSVHNLSLIKICQESGIKSALLVHKTLDVLYGINLDVAYLIAPQHTAMQHLKEWQDILQDYLCDCKLIYVIQGKEEEILQALEIRIDGILLADSFKK